MYVWVCVYICVHVFSQLWFPLWLRFFFTNTELRFHSNSKKHISMAGVLHVRVFVRLYVCVCVCEWLMALGFFKRTLAIGSHRSRSRSTPLFLSHSFSFYHSLRALSCPSPEDEAAVAAAVQMRLPKIFSLMELSGFLWLLGLQIYVQYVHKHTNTYVCI